MLASERRPAGLAGRSSSCRRRRRRRRGSPTLRCHDDIGWAIDDERRRGGRAERLRAPAVPLGLLRRRVPRVVGARAGVPGEPGHRRPADLRARWPRWPGSRPATRTPSQRILLAHAMVLGFGGLPVIWMGDELGLLNDPDWAAEPDHAGGQPVGAPAADAVAACRPTSTASRPGVRHLAPGPGGAAAPARVGAGDGARPPRPGRAAGRAPAPARADARGLQRHADPRHVPLDGAPRPRPGPGPWSTTSPARRRRSATARCSSRRTPRSG